MGRYHYPSCLRPLGPFRAPWLFDERLVRVLDGVMGSLDFRATYFPVGDETSFGNRLSQAFNPRSGIDPQSDFVSNRDVVFIVREWGKPVVSDAIGSALVFGSRTRPRRVTRLHVEQSVDASGDVLSRLRNSDGSHNDLCRAVLDAEVVLFAADEIEEVCVLLRDFILRFRASNSREDLIAVGSAIRKYIVYLSKDDLHFAAQLLEVGPRGPVPLEVELEVSKAILNRVKKNPFHDDDAEPILSKSLTEIADEYLSARLLAREKYGATALNAVLSLALLRSSSIDQVARKIEEARQAWFSKLVVRQASVICNDFSVRFSGDVLKGYCKGLHSLINHARKKT